MNLEAAILKNTCRAAAEAITRDATCAIQGAPVLVIEGIMNPKRVEAIASREGLALANDLMLRRVRLACDNSSVVRSFKGVGFESYG